MRIPDLIALKRDGGTAPEGAMRDFALSVGSGGVPDYQAAAFLMACRIRGLDLRETVELTLGMRDSGTVMTWPEDPRPLADKHSTGGVGDKISLVLAPLAASMGLRVPMVSGRGLGHTGGTLDKLEAIPGFRTDPGRPLFTETVQRHGFAMSGPTADTAPADRMLYALRDATSTVDSIPLICASILSKKLAEGVGTLVLDVKCGRGAFMRDREQARRLAGMLVEVAGMCGVGAKAFVTDMDTVLGRCAGNALETAEAIEVLEGGGPSSVRDLSVRLASAMVTEARGAGDSDAVGQECRGRLDDGTALRVFERVVEAQGGDLDAFRARHPAPARAEVRSDRAGYWAGADAGVAGEVVRSLGAGRYRTDDTVRHDTGWEQVAESGFPVEDGSLIGWVHAPSRDEAERAAKTIFEASIWDEVNQPLVMEEL